MRHQTDDSTITYTLSQATSRTWHGKPSLWTLKLFKHQIWSCSTAYFLLLLFHIPWGILFVVFKAWPQGLTDWVGPPSKYIDTEYNLSFQTILQQLTNFVHCCYLQFVSNDAKTNNAQKWWPALLAICCWNSLTSALLGSNDMTTFNNPLPFSSALWSELPDREWLSRANGDKSCMDDLVKASTYMQTSSTEHNISSWEAASIPDKWA